MSSQFYSVFEPYLEKISVMREIDLENMSDILESVCRYFDICRITVGFFKDTRAEATGEGELITVYDKGGQGVVSMKKRLVTEIASITDCTVYKSEDSPEWDDDKKRQAELFNNVTMMAVSRSTMTAIAKRRTFFDDDGYRNLNTYIRYIEDRAAGKTLKGNAAIHFNLKHFSLINQQIGRQRGTAVMHSFIDGLTELIGKQGIVCRMGGDNFVLFTPLEKLDRVTEYLSGSAVPYNRFDDRVMVNTTAGVLVIDEGFEYGNPSHIMDRIISASQSAKNGGAEDIVFFSTEMEKRKEKIMRLQQLFPKALENGEFLIYYQPKVEIKTGRLIGAEALCRWQHEGELINPDDFIPTYEQSMDICKLDFYMLDHVCRDLRKWLDEGSSVVRVSVNLSRKHMMDIDLVDNIISIIDKWRIPHKYIEIELTETTTDVEFKDIKRVVRGLQKAGISTAIDDFGIGYSSLNLISEIPWNVIKIDKSLIPVKGDNEQSPRSVMFGHVVKMAKEMGLECISEGVETQEQIDAMIENGCDMVQGFFFDKPLPLDKFAKRLAEGGYGNNE